MALKLRYLLTYLYATILFIILTYIRLKYYLTIN